MTTDRSPVIIRSRTAG